MPTSQTVTPSDISGGSFVGQRVKAKLRELFGIDLRSLASFRIVLAALILVDLAYRIPSIEANYTDDGVLPRNVIAPHFLFRLFFLSGDYWVQACLFVLTGLFAMMLLVGYRTRLATLGTWLLLGSIQARNYWLLDGGDYVARLYLFWSLFLPLGATFSFDARTKAPYKRNNRAVLSVASIAIICQFCFMYVNGGLLKSGPEWRTEGTALASFLASEEWTLPLGEFLLNYPTLLKCLTLGVVYFEIFGPLLLFSPVWTTRLRIMAIIGFLLLQIGIRLCISFHMFPWYSTVGLLLFLPSRIWESVLPKTGARPARSESDVVTPQSAATSPLLLGARLARDLIGGAALFLVLWLNLDMAAVWEIPNRVERFAQRAGLYQQWYMYDSAIETDVSPRLVGDLENQSVVVLLDVRGPSTWKAVRQLHESHRFRVYLHKLLMNDPLHSRLQLCYLRWLCHCWNDAAEEGRRLKSIRLSAVVREISDKELGPAHHYPVARCDCSEVE